MQQFFIDLLSKMPNLQADSPFQATALTGGLNNSNWILEVEQQHFFVKIFGAGTEQFIDRQLSCQALTMANTLHIAPQLVYFDADLKTEVTEFLLGYRATLSSDYFRADFLAAVMQIYKRLHHAPRLGSDKTVFEMTDEHIAQGDALGAIRPVDFAQLLQHYQQAKQAFFASGLDLVPCHNDPMPGNFMVKMHQDQIVDMKLIDFEFASNNERAYELGVFLGEVFVDEAQSLELIEDYYGHVKAQTVARIFVARAIADIKWGSWALQQRQLSDWDFDYQKYGLWKYARARMLFQDPRWQTWLHQI
jgi:thiamine kinase-like enzyme